MNAELRETIVDVALSLSPTYQNLQLQAEWLRMQIKHHETEAGEAKKRLRAIENEIERVRP